MIHETLNCAVSLMFTVMLLAVMSITPILAIYPVSRVCYPSFRVIEGTIPLWVGGSYLYIYIFIFNIYIYTHTYVDCMLHCA